MIYIIKYRMNDEKIGKDAEGFRRKAKSIERQQGPKDDE